MSTKKETPEQKPDAGAIPEPENLDEKLFQAWLENIPVLTPQDMSDKLADKGYIGQEYARKAVALTAYRHVQRIRRIHRRLNIRMRHMIRRQSRNPNANTVTAPDGRFALLRQVTALLPAYR